MNCTINLSTKNITSRTGNLKQSHIYLSLYLKINTENGLQIQKYVLPKSFSYKISLEWNKVGFFSFRHWRYRALWISITGHVPSQISLFGSSNLSFVGLTCKTEKWQTHVKNFAKENSQILAFCTNSRFILSLVDYIQRRTICVISKLELSDHLPLISQRREQDDHCSDSKSSNQSLNNYLSIIEFETSQMSHAKQCFFALIH